MITAGRLGPTRHGRHGWACGMVARSGLAARPTDTTNRPAGGGRSGLGRRHRLGTGRGVRATGGPCRLGPGASRDPARGRPAHADRPRGASQQLITSLTKKMIPGNRPSRKAQAGNPPPCRRATPPPGPGSRPGGRAEGSLNKRPLRTRRGEPGGPTLPAPDRKHICVNYAYSA